MEYIPLKKADMVEAQSHKALQQNRSVLAGGHRLQEVKMKRFILPLVLSLLTGTLFSAFSFAGESRGITILYTGAVKGNIEPCKT
jgi:hypothetical protein